MSTLAFNLGAVSNNEGFDQVITPDPIIVPGTALYIEPASAGWPWLASGAPTVGSKVPNQAWPQLAAMIGSGTAESLALTATASTPAPELVQRTTKGGLHVGHKKSSGGSAESRSFGLASTPLKDYVAAHQANSWYMGLITVITDDATSTPSQTARLAGYITNSSTPMMDFMVTTSVLSAYATGNRTNVQTLPRTENAPGLLDASWSTISGTPNSDLIWVGHNGGAGSPNVSTVLYALLLENLTVSGRSYATVHAAMQAKVTAWFAPGGKYQGDTYTNPGTL